VKDGSRLWLGRIARTGLTPDGGSHLELSHQAGPGIDYELVPNGMTQYMPEEIQGRNDHNRADRRIARAFQGRQPGRLQAFVSNTESKSRSSMIDGSENLCSKDEKETDTC
jgi:hypothetical protein